MSLVDKIKNTQSLTLTENGALALNNTGSALLDMFSTAGALRSRKDEDIIHMYDKAFIEDRPHALKLAFYARDVRGGLGERRTARLMFRYLAKYHPEDIMNNLYNIAEYGRYDDIIDLIDIIPNHVVRFVKAQLMVDKSAMKEGHPVSLLAKWLPSVNASSKDTVRKARFLAEKLGMSEKEYRRTLSALRAYMKVVEVDMSAKRFGEIDYPSVPSRAMLNYRKAFMRNDEKRFNSYLESLFREEEEVKINSSTLYPYDIIEKYLYSGIDQADPVLEAQWAALPEYVEGNERFLVMADVSGSMSGRPIATSIGLAIYFAQRNKGPFVNHFMTFSSRPELVEIKGDTLPEKIRYIVNKDWEMNTDLEAAFNLLLESAVRYNVPQEEMPTSIVVITDMEFDSCANNDWLFYDNISQKYAECGYQLPNIVFWNVNSMKNTFHASHDKKGVQLASGQSPSVFATLCGTVEMTPYEYMLSVLDGSRYDRIVI